MKVRAWARARARARVRVGVRAWVRARVTDIVVRGRDRVKVKLTLIFRIVVLVWFQT